MTINHFIPSNGNINNEFPAIHWKKVFIRTRAGTKVEIEISFSSEADLEKILEMGFVQGKWGAIGSLLGAGSFTPSFFIPID